MFSVQLNKQLDFRALLVFERVQRFSTSFVVLAALISGLALSIMSYSEFHPSSSTTVRVAEGFLTSSALTAIIAAVLATMLLFLFEGQEKPTRKDLGVAWLPLVFLDLSIVELLVGLVCWYSSKNDHWRSALMQAQVAALLAICVVVAVWMWLVMAEKGGLGKEERDRASETDRVADK